MIMKNIKTYEDFVNEEINWKKALATGALATGMAMSNPSYSQTINKQDSILPSRVDKDLVEIQQIYKLDADSIGKYSFYNGVWSNIQVNYKKDETDIVGVNSEFTSDIYSSFIKSNNNVFFCLSSRISYITKDFITTESEYKKIISNINNYNKEFEIIFVHPYKDISKLNLFTNDVINSIESKKNSIGPIKKMIIKTGYVDGKKVVRFVMVDIDSQFDIDKAYLECPFEEFIKLLKTN